MAITFRLNKYTQDELLLQSSVEITEFIEQDFSILRQLEFDSVWNFAVSHVELEIADNSNFLSEFKNSTPYQLPWWEGGNNINDYLWGIEIAKNGNNIFVGQLLPGSIEHDSTQQIFRITARDWYKYFYEKLADREKITDNLFLNVEDFMAYCFPIYNFPEQGILSGRVINVNNQLGGWTSIPSFILSSNLLSYQHLLKEVQKHYGAYFFVDKDYKINLINRQKYTNSVANEIQDYILENDYEETPFLFNEYDALIINQSTPSGSSTEVSWRLFYRKGGVLEEEQIFSEDALEDLPENLKILDLRQELFVQGDGASVSYSFYKGFGYRIFPQRTRDEIYEDYKNILERPNKIKCSVKLPDNLRIDIMNKIWISNQESFGEFIPTEIEEFPMDNVYKLTLLRNSLRGAH